MSDAYQGITDGRLTPEDFFERFGDVDALSLWGARWVGTAITEDRRYIAFNHATGEYETERI